MTRSPLCLSRHSLAFALLAAPSMALAAGVDAGTLISNTATATYTSGSTSGSVQSNTVTLKVDELLDVAVTATSGSPVIVGASVGVLPFVVTNLGNGPEAFRLTVQSAVNGNAFDVAVSGVVADTNGNGSYDPGVDVAVGADGAIRSLTADEALAVFVLVRRPADASDGATSQLRLVAEAITGTGAPGRSFAGEGEGGGDAVVGATGARDETLAGMTASSATVALAKSFSIRDPFGGSQPVPGAVVTYAISATITGSGAIDDLRITDAVPAGTTYNPGSLALDAVAQTDASDADAGSAGANGILVALGNLAGGQSHTVTFDVTID